MSDIDTLDDWNARLSCCCPMPACPVPIKRCKSAGLAVYAYGLYSPLETDGPEVLGYKKRCWDYSVDTSDSTNSSLFYIWDGSFWEARIDSELDYVDSTITKVGNIVRCYQTDEAFTVNVCGGGTSPSFYYACSGTYTETYEYWAAFYDSSGTGSYDIFMTLSITNAWVNVGGTETDEHAAWVAGGSIGPEPQEFYDPCTYRCTTATHEYSVTHNVDGTNTHTEDPGSPTTTVTYGFPGFPSVTPTTSEQVTTADLAARFDAEAAALDVEECADGTSCESTRYSNSKDEMFGVKSQPTWVVPTSWVGTYFKATWDVWNFPDVGAPAAISTDLTEEWTGPGAGPQTDPSWIIGAAHVLDIPAELGYTKTANLRFICRHDGPYGNKPQTYGDTAP